MECIDTVRDKCLIALTLFICLLGAVISILWALLVVWWLVLPAVGITIILIGFFGAIWYIKRLARRFMK